jgi:hypothetical protein
LGGGDLAFGGGGFLRPVLPASAATAVARAGRGAIVGGSNECNECGGGEERSESGRGKRQRYAKTQ